MIDIDTIIAYHLAWKERLRNWLNGQAELTLSEIGTHEQCELGCWLHGDGRTACGSLPEFAELERSHRELHDVALSIFTAASAGKRDQFSKELLHLDHVSLKVFSLLVDIERQIKEFHEPDV